MIEQFDDEGYFELWRLLLLTRDAVRKARQTELDRHGIHVRRVALLNAVRVLGKDATPVAIGEWLFRQRHSVSELLSRAEKDGLVKRIHGADRNDRVRVALTTKGNKTWSKLTRADSVRHITTSLPADELEELKTFLSRLKDAALGILGLEGVVRTPLEPEYQWYGLLIEATDAIQKARERELDENHVNRGWSGILLSIAALGTAATPNAIAQRLLRERHSVYELLSKMENGGAVKKVKGLEGRLALRVAMTPKGRELYRRVTQGKTPNTIMSSLTQEESHRFELCLENLLKEALKELHRQRYAAPPAYERRGRDVPV